MSHLGEKRQPLLLQSGKSTPTNFLKGDASYPSSRIVLHGGPYHWHQLREVRSRNEEHLIRPLGWCKIEPEEGTKASEQHSCVSWLQLSFMVTPSFTRLLHTIPFFCKFARFSTTSPYISRVNPCQLLPSLWFLCRCNCLPQTFPSKPSPSTANSANCGESVANTSTEPMKTTFWNTQEPPPRISLRSQELRLSLSAGFRNEISMLSTKTSDLHALDRLVICSDKRPKRCFDDRHEDQAIPCQMWDDFVLFDYLAVRPLRFTQKIQQMYAMQLASICQL